MHFFRFSSYHKVVKFLSNLAFFYWEWTWRNGCNAQSLGKLEFNKLKVLGSAYSFTACIWLTANKVAYNINDDSYTMTRQPDCVLAKDKITFFLTL